MPDKPRRKRKRKRKASPKQRVVTAAVEAAQQAARDKVARGQPTTPLQRGILVGLSVLTVLAAVVAVYLFTVHWPDEQRAVALSGDIDAQVAQFDRLQTRIDMKRSLLHRKLRIEPAEETDPAAELDEGIPAGEDETGEPSADDLPSVEELFHTLANSMRAAYACLHEARRLADSYLAMYEHGAIGYDSVHANLQRLAQEEPLFLERAREVERLADEHGISLADRPQRAAAAGEGSAGRQ